MKFPKTKGTESMLQYDEKNAHMKKWHEYRQEQQRNGTDTSFDDISDFAEYLLELRFTTTKGYVQGVAKKFLFEGKFDNDAAFEKKYTILLNRIDNKIIDLGLTTR